MSSEKLRVLALHGYMQSADIFKEKTGAFRKATKKHIEMVYMDSPHIILASDEDATHEKIKRGWWFITPGFYRSTEYCDTAIGLEESIKAITKKLEDDGPFDGILGFSQGAAMVGILSSLRAKGEIPAKSFGFSILFSGYKSRCSLHSDLYSPSIFLPSLHVYGETDEKVATDMSEELSYLFDQPTRLIHPGGHYVPASGQFNPTYKDYFSKILDLKSSPS